MPRWEKTIDTAPGGLLWYMSPLAKFRLSTKIGDEPNIHTIMGIRKRADAITTHEEALFPPAHFVLLADSVMLLNIS